MTGTRKRTRTTGRGSLSKARLDELIEQAIVDSYNESQQVTGLYTMIEIVAVCRRAGGRQTVPLVDLPLPSPPPAGTEWIAASRRWLGGR